MTSEQAHLSVLADGEGLKSARRILRWIILAILAAFIARETLAARTVLLTEMPILLKGIAYLAGLILGGILAYLIIKFGIGSERPFRTIFGAIAGIPLSILACSYLSRFAFELAA